MDTEEQQREVQEAEAEAAEGGLALQGRQPRQHNIASNTTTLITTTGSGLSSEHYGGTESLVEGGRLISYEYFEVKSEGVDFCDSKTSPGHVILDVATKKLGFQTSGREVEQTATDTSINIIGTSEPGRYELEYFTKESELQEKDLYFETVYENPDTYELYCPKCKVHIHMLLIRSRDDELRCPSCSEFLRPIGADFCDSKTSPGVDVIAEKRIGIQLTSGEINIEDEDHIKNNSSTPVVNPPPSKNLLQEQIATDTSINVGTTEQEGGDFNFTKERELKETQLYLKTVYKKPETYEFYCPKCKVCIDKVLIRRRDDELRCPSCFEFLKPIGDWFFRKPQPIDPGNQKSIEPEPVDTVHPPPPPPPTLTPPRNPEQHGAIKLEILKSIVYGGLIESITSLSVVTSAASAAAATVNIVALALANLIGGLFVIGHNLRELKNDQSRVTSNETDEQVDRYLEVLGQKRNFILHASVAVLSFLIFGLVPPVVYGFSFYDSDNRSLKLAAASLICITVLAIVQAYIQNPPKLYTYLTTVLHYFALGVGAACISYLAGYLVKKLIEKLGWFE